MSHMNFRFIVMVTRNESILEAVYISMSNGK
jgi:hypothetical protein